MKDLDLSGFGSLPKSKVNSGGFSSNKMEVLKNLDDDIAYAEKNGIKLKNIGNTALYELRCFKKAVDGVVRVGLRCRGKNVYLNEAIWKSQQYRLCDDNKDDVIKGMKWYKKFVEENMSEKDSLYYGSKGLKELTSF